MSSKIKRSKVTDYAALRINLHIKGLIVPMGAVKYFFKIQFLDSGAD